MPSNSDSFSTGSPGGESSATSYSADSPADRAREAWETTRDKAGEAWHAGEQYVRDNPASSALSLVGFGFVLGVAVGWAIAHQENDPWEARMRELSRMLRRG